MYIRRLDAILDASRCILPRRKNKYDDEILNQTARVDVDEMMKKVERFFFPPIFKH